MWSVPLLLVALLCSPADAGPSLADEAEAQRLSSEMQRLSARSAWSGVESAYFKLLELERQGITLTYDNHLLAAQAARARGNIGELQTRLQRALDINETDQVRRMLGEIAASYAPLTISVDPAYTGRIDFRAEEIPFDSVKRAAVDFPPARLSKKREFEGLIPEGAYLIQGHRFVIIPGAGTTQVQVDAAGQAVSERVNTGAEGLGLHPFVALGVSFTGSTDAAEPLSPANLVGPGARVGVGAMLMPTRTVGVHLELGYHSVFGKSQMHIGYGWAAARLELKPIALTVGPTMALGRAKASGSTLCDSESRADICDDLDAMLLTDADRQALLDETLFRGSLTMSGATASVTLPVFGANNLSGQVGLFGGILNDSTRWYPWAQLGFVIAR